QPPDGQLQVRAHGLHPGDPGGTGTPDGRGSVGTGGASGPVVPDARGIDRRGVPGPGRTGPHSTGLHRTVPRLTVRRVTVWRLTVWRLTGPRRAGRVVRFALSGAHAPARILRRGQRDARGVRDLARGGVR